MFYFGHGLSYTTFAYGGLVIHPQGQFHPCNSVRVRVAVTNTGSTAGDTIVFVFGRIAGTRSRSARMDLLGFARTGTMQPGLSTDVRITIAAEVLTVVVPEGRKGRYFQPGQLTLWVAIFHCRIYSAPSAGIRAWRIVVWPSLLHVKY